MKWRAKSRDAVREKNWKSIRLLHTRDIIRLHWPTFLPLPAPRQLSLINDTTDNNCNQSESRVTLILGEFSGGGRVSGAEGEIEKRDEDPNAAMRPRVASRSP